MLLVKHNHIKKRKRDGAASIAAQMGKLAVQVAVQLVVQLAVQVAVQVAV